jgi:hypothetical protein
MVEWINMLNGKKTALFWCGLAVFVLASYEVLDTVWVASVNYKNYLNYLKVFRSFPAAESPSVYLWSLVSSLVVWGVVWSVFIFIGLYITKSGVKKETSDPVLLRLFSLSKIINRISLQFRMAIKLTKLAFAEISVEASPTEVSRTMKEIFATIGISFVGENINRDSHGIELSGKRGMTFRSWGDKVKIEIMEDGHGGSIVRAESATAVPTTIFDYGQNKENLERIFVLLMNRYKNNSPLTLKEKIL